MSVRGIVYLVGAGPGDPKLLTVRALELIRAAEVVAHDELVSPEILSLAGPGAEVLAVGRRHGFGKTDYRLHPLVLERALAGRVVVRLKSGDPLIFGRGAEEAEELAEAGIPFEIVPGVSAALGAAACAGIPLTDRRFASRVTLRTGHQAEDGGGHARETLVFYMAANRLRENLERLLEEGCEPSTPAAYIAAATTPRQVVVTGVVADLADRVEAVRCSDPALLIVGEVARLRERIAWFEKAPLRGRRVMLARARPGPSRIAARLRALGAIVLERPKVSIAEACEYSALEQALRETNRYDAIVFGCSAGVEAASGLLGAINSKAAPKTEIPVITVGPEAADTLERSGISPVLRLDGACREAIAKETPAFAGKHLLLVASTRGRPNLMAELETAGATVELAPAYRPAYDHAAALRELPELIVLPSSSAAHLLLGGEDRGSLMDLPMLAIGPLTEAAARTLGATNVKRCQTDSIDSVVATVMETMCGLAPDIQDQNRTATERADAVE